MALSEKLRSDFGFGHTLDPKLLPRGKSSVNGPTVRLLKPFDEHSVDFQVLLNAASDHIDRIALVLLLFQV